MPAADFTQIALSALIGAPLIGAAILVGVCVYCLAASHIRRPRPTRAQRTMWGL